MQNDTLDNITLMQDSTESNLYFIQNVGVSYGVTYDVMISLVLFNYIETLSSCDKKEDNNNYDVSSLIYVNMHLLLYKA